MQSAEVVPVLAISMIITCIALAAVIRSWWKSRLYPTLLYTLAIGSFSGMVIDLLLDQTYLPFRDWELIINAQVLWMSNILLAFFIVGGFLFWFFAIMYSQFDSPPIGRSLVVTFIAGGALVGDLVKGNWSEEIPVAIDGIAFAILIVVIIQYSVQILRITSDPIERRVVTLYFVGFLVWIMAGPLGIVIANIPGVPSWVGNQWTTPYSIGLLLIAYTVARNPRLLFISEAKPLDFMVLDKDGVLMFTQRFYKYSKSTDPELVGSAISGIISLMREMLATGEKLQRVDHGDIKILLEYGVLTTGLLIVSKETSRFRQSLRNAVMEFETNYREELIHSNTALATTFNPFKARAEEIFL
jgi:hypothetical protein